MNEILSQLGIEANNLGAFAGEWYGSGKPLASVSPIDGREIATVTQASKDDYEKVIARAHSAF